MKKKIVIVFIIIFSFAILAFGIGWLIANGNNGDSHKETDNTIANETTSTTKEAENDNFESSKLGNKKLIFIHHSTGENWLRDGYGNLGNALKNEGYYVSDTNYGWGPDSIGDTTDIGHWWLWFRSKNSSKYMKAVFKETSQHSEYSRLSAEPKGENEIIMFKSCFPNSALKGNASASPTPIKNNPLKGQDSYSDAHTVGNAKGIYVDLLEYFKTKPDKLFIAVTAPPLSDSTYAENARAVNNWMKNELLSDYPYDNVVVFDFYDVLTGGSGNTLAYPSGDDHPNEEGSRKATEEFIVFLNKSYEKWLDS